MAKFFAGFATASALWAGLAGVLLALGWGPPGPRDADVAEEAALVQARKTVPGETPTPRRRQARSRGAVAAAGGSGSGTAPRGEMTTGDDLREDEMRVIDGAGSGGEQQLTGAQIDAAFDAAMGRIRRCFLLAPGEEPITGRLTFGLRIAGSGAVTAVQLSGPAAVTTGESGDCLRGVARQMRFASFDGPEMLVRYPITLE